MSIWNSLKHRLPLRGRRPFTIAMPVTMEKLEDAKGIAVISFNKEPVNSMNLDFWKALKSTFEAAEADKTIRGVVFQSTLKKNIFTAGLDINELYAPSTSEERLKDFWTTLTQTLTSIYRSRLATVAAINGACPAGGCALAMCCDWRIITWEGSMGLNEVALGIPVPRNWCELMMKITGQHPAEDLLLSASMPQSTDLRQIGMVDDIVEKPEELLPMALERLKKWLKFPPQGFSITKRHLRDEFAKRWVGGIKEEAEEVWRAVSDPRSVKALDVVIKRLHGAHAKL
eukprot:s1614_g2.t1